MTSSMSLGTEHDRNTHPHPLSSGPHFVSRGHKQEVDPELPRPQGLRKCVGSWAEAGGKGRAEEGHLCPVRWEHLHLAGLPRAPECEGGSRPFPA